MVVSELYKLLTNKQKKKLLYLQLLMLITAVMELVGVGSILPFVSIVASPEVIDTNSYINSVYVFAGSPDKKSFLVFSGFLFFAVLLLTMIFNIMTVFAFTKYSFDLGSQLSMRLFSYYLKQPIMYHLQHTSAQLIARVRTETRRVTMRIIMAALRFNSKILSISLLSIFLVYVNPIVAMVAILVFILAYLPIYYFLGKRAKRNGRAISELEIDRNRLLYDSFSAIREITLYSKSKEIGEEFGELSNEYALREAENELIRHTPYYLIESLSMAFVILITLYFLIVSSGKLESLLPLVAFYTFAGYKLIPMYQQCYRALVAIRGATPAYEKIRSDLLSSLDRKSCGDNSDILRLSKRMEFNSVSFSYPGADKPVFTDLSFSIQAGCSVAVIGKTGVGKSTLVDLLMGLILPNSGYIAFDDVVLNKNNQKRLWKNISYVPQHVYISDSSIAENVAFSEHYSDVEYDRVWWALKVACLSDFVKELPEGVHTKVGEKGSKLSGGQIQRLGIARAVYRKSGLMVLDEATNGLDVATQELVMRNIRSLSTSVTTIWITHRMEVLKFVDAIYEMSDSAMQITEVVNEGCFQK